MTHFVLLWFGIPLQSIQRLLQLSWSRYCQWKTMILFFKLDPNSWELSWQLSSFLLDQVNLVWHYHHSTVRKKNKEEKNAINTLKLQKTAMVNEFLIDFFSCLFIKTWYIKLLFFNYICNCFLSSYSKFYRLRLLKY